MPDLTAEQKSVLLYVGGAAHDEPYLPRQVLNELVSMGLLLSRRGLTQFELSDEGEHIYDSLVSGKIERN